MDNIESKDERLWKIARKRAAFKRHLVTYLLINAMLWLIWLVNAYRLGSYTHIWPIWVSFGWGIGIFFDFINSYFSFKESMEEHEYRKLINRQ